MSCYRCLCGDVPGGQVEVISIFQTFLGNPCPIPNPCDFRDLVREISTLETFVDILSFAENNMDDIEEDFRDFDEVGASLTSMAIALIASYVWKWSALLSVFDSLITHTSFFNIIFSSWFFLKKKKSILIITSLIYDTPGPLQPIHSLVLIFDVQVLTIATFDNETSFNQDPEELVILDQIISLVVTNLLNTLYFDTGIGSNQTISELVAEILAGK